MGRKHVAPVFARARIQENMPGEFNNQGSTPTPWALVPTICTPPPPFERNPFFFIRSPSWWWYMVGGPLFSGKKKTNKHKHFRRDGVRDKQEPSLGQMGPLPGTKWDPSLGQTGLSLLNSTVKSPFCPVCPWDGWGFVPGTIVPQGPSEKCLCVFCLLVFSSPYIFDLFGTFKTLWVRRPFVRIFGAFRPEGLETPVPLHEKRKKTDKKKSHKGIWRSDAPEASQGQTRDVPGTPGTFGPDLCVNQY